MRFFGGCVLTTRKIIGYVCVLVILLFGTSVPVRSQSAALSGTVLDTSGASVPRAHISVVNVANGATVEMKSPFVTPAPVDLAPGTYEITMSNPAFRSPITRNVDVKAGQEQLINVAFADPATATLPQLGGGTP